MANPFILIFTLEELFSPNLFPSLQGVSLPKRQTFIRSTNAYWILKLHAVLGATNIVVNTMDQTLVPQVPFSC
jgi:hypothetical protein